MLENKKGERKLKKLLILTALLTILLTARAVPQEEYWEDNFIITAYSYESGSITASGTEVCYGTVAVDPDVIPLGSKVYVEDYGYATALDTGGAIQGNRIDIWLPSEEEALDYGIKEKKVRVYY